MSSIGPSHGVSRPDPTKPDRERPDPRSAGDARRGDDDTFTDSGGGRHFGSYGGGAGHHDGGRAAGDPAGPHGPGEPSAGDGAQQAELARRAGDFRRSLNAALATGAAAAGEAGSRREGAIDDDAGREHTGDPHGAGAQTGREGDGPAAGDGMSGLAQLFARRGRDDSRRNEPGAREDGQAQEHAAQEEVLAASSFAAGSTLPLLSSLQPAQEPATGARGHAIAGTVEERVTQAIRAELAGQSAATNTISIDLTGLVEGLAAITIRMSATGLDVVLSGSLDLGGEALALADRLSRRFGNRSVRILATPAGDGRTAEHGQADSGDGRPAAVARRTGDTA
ncbi:hypothetical protein ACUSIJ_02775 [Pseudochelatococcus sp. B33]